MKVPITPHRLESRYYAPPPIVISLGSFSDCFARRQGLWKPWEKVFSDSSGKFRVMSLQGNRYYSVFVCARSGLWTEDLFRSQEELTLSYGVLEILGQNWTFHQAAGV